MPDATQTFIQGIVYGGSGCNQGTVVYALSEDQTVLTLLLDEFVASTGPGTAVIDSAKTCQLTMDLRYPSGWTYSIVSVNYRGFVQLPIGMTAIQTSKYSFSGSQSQATLSTMFWGPVQKDYLISDKLEPEELVWAPCGEAVQSNLNVAVSIIGDFSKVASLSHDSLDQKVEQKYGILWKQC